MKEYKVETLIYYTQLTADSKHIAKSSQKEIQEKLDEYSQKAIN
jgi:galactokinase/mevalonate kinase-like predicted kinase